MPSSTKQLSLLSDTHKKLIHDSALENWNKFSKNDQEHILQLMKDRKYYFSDMTPENFQILLENDNENAKKYFSELSACFEAEQNLDGDSAARLCNVLGSGYGIDIEKETIENDNFRKVLYTSPNLMQLVLMTLKPGEDIGSEIHPETDQFIRVESGEGVAYIGIQKYKLKDGFSIVIPAGQRHNVINTSNNSPLKLYTIYAPPEHEDHLVEKNKNSKRVGICTRIYKPVCGVDDQTYSNQCLLDYAGVDLQHTGKCQNDSRK